jgi:Ser/Thr protein kinase RdoA (MazF antagonist)
VIGEQLSNIFIRRNSYVNRVLELEKEKSGERIIVKFYRPGRWNREEILEEHKFLAELEDNEVSVISPLHLHNETLFCLDNINFAVFPKRGGRSLDEFDETGWETIGRIISRIHLAGEKHRSSLRINWRPASATRRHLDILLKSSFIIEDFKDAVVKLIDDFMNKFDPAFDSGEAILLHGDMHKGNLIHRPGEGIYVIDFDDICVGPPVQDLWMLLPDKPENCKNEIRWFLKGYETFRPFEGESLKLVNVLRGMRIIHFTSWLSIQEHDPDFSKHFPEAGTKKYWKDIISELDEIVYPGAD